MRIKHLHNMGALGDTSDKAEEDEHEKIDQVITPTQNATGTTDGGKGRQAGEHDAVTGRLR